MAMFLLAPARRTADDDGDWDVIDADPMPPQLDAAPSAPALAGLLAGSKDVLASTGAKARSFGRTLKDTLGLGRVAKPARSKTATIVAFVPAHNEQDDIARTLDGLLSQSRPLDRIVVILDNCTDDTAKIVARYRRVTVMETVGNVDKKVGALTQAWQAYAHAYDFMLGVDADTVLAPEAVAQLEDEMIRVPSAAGVMARYTFDMKLATSWVSRQLIRAQRVDFASWLTDIMAKERSTYVLGGQATLFRVKHLQDVADTHERNSPWDPDAQVEDMELTWRLHEAGRKTLVSATARAYAGPMVTMKGLMGQRRKWDEGMAALLWKNKMPDKNTIIPWKQQFSMFANGLSRLMFALMLAGSLMVHQFVWSPIWLIPIAIGVALNLKTVWRMPDRTPGDVVYALAVVPAEIWMVSRVWTTMVSWLNIWFGARRDGWALQAAAENGGGKGGSAIGKIILGAVLGGSLVAAGTWWWVTQASLQVQEKVLTTGWSVLTVLTITMSVLALIKLLKPTRGFKP